ncbi:1-deoxy-D-xylulose-5-phosphate reductoisomerase [Massilibacterium senegalense]|uniref:1-deoxy-D-xylulose-5-phosphate reductoisomerase n=1 Tax=Massilibacterium senegalense TaxID=1632858 RepID=UPI0007808903|nr:1-deoxy-D-xylulose-5-phosphate reductoisomerase [Massilibacterium senegalense]
MRKISLLGATGSIGTQTLDVIRTHREEFQLIAMSVGYNLALAEQIIHEFQPEVVSVIEKEAKEQLTLRVPSHVKIVYGKEGLLEVATHKNSDVLVNAIIGSVGLIPTLEAIKQKKTIAIANKETLVTAGHLVMKSAKDYGVQVLPIDSEHSAILQCLQSGEKKEISRLILTASGGSFRDKKRYELANVTVEEALKHPNWSMGAKITIDSATMMNKGLEVIEAHWLFDVPYEQIDVLLHRESMIHSMVEFTDKSVIAQLGTPDMRVPIQYALTYPKRLPLPITKSLQLWEIGALHFEKMDFNRFKCLQYAYEAGRIGGTMPTVLNAANEAAVKFFLKGKISFLTIEQMLEQALNRHQPLEQPSLDTIQLVDKETREFVNSLLS